MKTTGRSVGRKAGVGEWLDCFHENPVLRYDCMLGASLVLNADEEALTEAYGWFREEAHHRCSSLHPVLA